MNIPIGTISQDEAKTLMKSGRFVTIDFTKRDGSKRKLTGRVGVAKDLKGIGMPYDAKEKNIVVVYEVSKKQYRAIKLDSINSIRANGTDFQLKAEPAGVAVP